MNRSLAEIFSLAANDIPELVDLCNLEAPEPMERILLAGAHLKPCEFYLARLPHIPFPLFPHLEKRGLDFQVHEEEDGCALILIRRRT